MKPAYYNEIDLYAAQWLRNLIAAGHIAPGDVDTRSIKDVSPNDLKPYAQCHFFAGVGVWSLALRRAGWADDRQIWTGSCPCQPFSAAGQGIGFADERHLWPYWHYLIEQCKPGSVLGEQVASKDADPWLDLVCTDLEALGYAFGAVAFPSAGLGAPHIRDRTYWVADTDGSSGREGGADFRERTDGSNAQPRARFSSGRMPDRLANTTGPGLQGSELRGQRADAQRSTLERDGAFGRLEHAGHDHDAGEVQAASDGQPQADRPSDQPSGSSIPSSRVADADGGYAGAERQQRSGEQRQQQEDGMAGGLADAAVTGQRELGGRGSPDARHERSYPHDTHQKPAASPINGFWSAADWLLCRDAKWRPVESGTFPLADGAASRVGRLRAYGNAVNAEAARIWVECVMEAQSRTSTRRRALLWDLPSPPQRPDVDPFGFRSPT